MIDYPPKPGRKVLLVGWDAADWKVINPLMDAGLMPALQSLVDRGVVGNLSTLDPPLSPMLWTSIATGKTADKHGVLGFVQPSEDGKSVRPVLGSTRTTKAVWNIFNQVGLRSNVIGWWPSHPAEPINGVMVSNFYHRLTGPPQDRSPMPSGAVHPPELADLMAGLRVHMQELTGNHLLPFVPQAASLEPSKNLGLGQVASTIAEASSVHAAATYALEHTEWDFAAVYYDAIDHFGHGFMRYRPPYREGVDQREYEVYNGVVDAGYRFHDMMLQRLLELVDDDTTVLLISDHGFHSDHLRPTSLPNEPTGPAMEHRDFGVFVMAGPGIKQDDRVEGASLLDIAPTLLTLFGLPVGQDMDGVPLVSAFQEPPEVAHVDSWDTISGEDGGYVRATAADAEAEREVMRQLVDLGYVDEAQMANVNLTVLESQYHLARVHLDRGRTEQAVPLLQAAFEADPEAERYGLRLVHALRSLGRTDEAHHVLDRVREGRLSRLERQRQSTQTLLDTLRADPATPPGRIERTERSLARVERKLGSDPAGLVYHRALVLMSEGRIEEALEDLSRVHVSGGNIPALTLRVGYALLRASRWADAEAAFRRVLDVDPENAASFRGIALSTLRQDRPEEAAAAALEAVALRYHFPEAHFHLGEALMRLGDYERAAHALEVTLAQNPAIRLAHVHLADIYRLHLGNVSLAQHHTLAAAESYGTP